MPPPEPSDEETRTELAKLLDPDSPIGDRIHVVACAVAMSCGNLTPDEQRSCAARLFDIPPECDLADAFVVIYQNSTPKRRLERLRRMAAISHYKGCPIARGR